ncbi:MAG TPA: DUF2225 domain-containing protein [Candidatus Tectomicrobia bacterium]|nr:DUF2225 domain-containing protein [Candidatus Tectomicrobia bacterium]
MTTLQLINLCCPVCGTSFRSHAVVSMDPSGGQATDFHRRPDGTQPLPYFVHTCRCCGYSGADDDFSDDVDVSPSLKASVWNELAPQLAGRAPSGSEKYEAAAKVAEWQGRESAHIGNLFLGAAWCCVDEGDTEAERYFRRHAAWIFELALASPNDVSSDERAVVTYLVGELWRRIGDLNSAWTWFDRVMDEVIDPETQQWVMDAARQQRDCPQEWFA